MGKDIHFVPTPESEVTTQLISISEDVVQTITVTVEQLLARRDMIKLQISILQQQQADLEAQLADIGATLGISDAVTAATAQHDVINAIKPSPIQPGPLPVG